MPKRFYKHKILLDENMSPRQCYPRLNQHFNIKHIRDDLNHGGSMDYEVYAIAQEQGRIIITANGKDFKKLLNATCKGVIDIPDGWSDSQVDTKLTALLMHHGQMYFTGQYRSLSQQNNLLE